MDSLHSLALESNRQMKINFDGGDLSSDAGLLLVKEFACKLGFVKMLKSMFKTKDTARLRRHKDDENLSDFEKAKLEFLKVIYPEKVIAPEDMEDFTKLWYGDFVPKKFIRAVKNSRKS